MDAENEKYVRVIADLTRTRYGLERSVVRLLKRYCDGARVDKKTLSIIVTEHQRQHVTSDFDGATILVLPTAEVKQTIMALVRGVQEDGLIQLMSYGRDVLELEREDSRIKSLSFGRYRETSNSEKQRQSTADPSISATEKAANVNEKSDVAAAQQSAPTAEPKKPVYRSEVFQEILIKRHLGPFPDHRPLVYNAVEKVVKSEVKVRVSELFQRAVTDAKAAAAERNTAAGKEPRVDDRLWAGIAKFSEQLFLEANALIGPDGERLGTDWRSRSLIVHELAVNWRASCDALLILGLVDEGEVLSSVEAKNLARALYHSSSEESENRVNEAVVYLLENGTLEETKDGLKRVRPSSETRMAPRLVS
jgi:hypothetical protein